VLGAGPPVLPPQLVVEVEAYPNPAPRKCVWVMLLICSLLVLRVQQDRYADVARWHSGGRHVTKDFPWEQRALVAGDEPFEATLFTPTRLGASTFQRPLFGADVITVGTGGVSRLGLGKGGATERGGSGGIPDEVTALLAGSGSGAAAGESCQGSNASKSCYMAVQRVQSFENGSSCSRFVAGASLDTMQSLAGTAGEEAGSMVCVEGTGIHSALPTRTVDKVAVAWEPLRQTSSRRGRHSCLAMVDFPPKAWGARTGDAHRSSSNTLKLRPSRTIVHDSTVLYDNASRAIVTVGFDRCPGDLTSLGSAKLIVHQFDAQTLEPRWAYHSLPLQVAWLLRSPQRSDGFLIFTVAESQEVSVGTTFVIDLVNHEVYEQGPTGRSGRKPPLLSLSHHTLYVTEVRPEDQPIPCGITEGEASCVLWRSKP